VALKTTSNKSIENEEFGSDFLKSLSLKSHWKKKN
jgi:hypothetical protein